MDKHAADNLNELLQHAIAGYAYAITVSSIWFELDMACENDPHRYCNSRGIEDDTLRIYNTAPRGDDDFGPAAEMDYVDEAWLGRSIEGGTTQATVGYNHNIYRPGRHALYFGHYDAVDAVRVYEPAQAKAELMHELGQVLADTYHYDLAKSQIANTTNQAHFRP